MTATGPTLQECFRALTGHDPFPWQVRLFERFVADDIPPALDVDTGLGKTMVIPIWLLGVAFQSHRGHVTLPRRLVYVVNRRTIVDQATEVATTIRNRLGNPGSAGTDRAALEFVASALASLSAIGGPCLAVSTLRGELADNREWILDPARPAVIVGTVDMIGSRLLFSGYGDGRYHRAHHAGLIGQDALIVHDEAHLVPAFSELLSAVAAVQRRDKDPRPIRVMELSATLTRASEGTMRLSQGDEEHPVIRERINARKRVRLHEPARDVCAQAVELALSHEQAPSNVLIYLRSPDDVLRVADRLIERLGAEGRDRVAVLTGTMRGWERQQAVESSLPYQHMLRPRRHEKSLYLVSTSAGEVGVDLDADHLVCDLTPLDSLVQRLGRVNRRGGPGRQATVDIVLGPVNERRSTPLDHALIATRDLLAAWNREASGQLDLCPGHLRALLGKVDPDILTAARSPVPVSAAITDPILDAWALTSITGPVMGRPAVAAYLHGLTADPPDVRLAWRREVSEFAARRVEDELITEWFQAFEIAAHECAVVPVTRTRKVFQALLAARRERGQASEDIDVVVLDPDGEARLQPLSCLADSEELLAQRTVVLPVEAGGLSELGIVDGASTTLVQDVAECGAPPAVRRLHVVDEAGERWIDLAGEAVPEPTSHALVTLPLLEASDTTDETMAIRELVFLTKPERATVVAPERVAAMQTLEDHTTAVTDLVARMSASLGLGSLTDVFVCAARWHDSGKSRPVWQRFACNDDPSVVLAKSVRYLDGRTLAGYRHEFGSMIDFAREASESADALYDLAMHLIAAHHGWGRPHFRRPAMDSFGAPTTLNQRTLNDTLSRFGRLQRRHGRWGLAWLESILRCADMCASGVTRMVAGSNEAGGR